MALAATLNPEAPEFQMPRSSFNPDAPEFKPTMQLRPEAADFIPMAGGCGWTTLQAAAEAYQQQQKQKRQMPYATDEEWDQRIAKREKEVETIKSLQSYRLYIEVFPPDKRGDDDPKTPDPRDRTVSKRMWKWNVEKWRLQLKSRCVYSRAVMLQCREFLLRQPAAEAGAEGAADESATRGLRSEPAGRLQTLSMPEPASRTSRVSRPPRGHRPPEDAEDQEAERASRKPAGAGTFQ
mmetsp:Transcript_44939/g.83998  ORF Transcript_44939/g.83998 Transcript_44939/m.83998 type:complete len:237 (-) Transcript_44939:169-879(-)